MQWIQFNDLIKELDQGTDMLLLDVRPHKDYETVHLKGSVPTYCMEMLTDQVGRTESLKKVVVTPEGDYISKPVIILCMYGGIGARTAWNDLRDIGFDMKNVYLLMGGANPWPHSHDQYVIRA